MGKSKTYCHEELPRLITLLEITELQEEYA